MRKKFFGFITLIFAISCLIFLISSHLSFAQNGTTWDIYSWMSRPQIQAMVDGASDGDTIFFHAGTYDWSSAPLTKRGDNEGAINIIDKTLVIKGEWGTVLQGRASNDPAGEYPEGVNAFYIQDLDLNNDVTFDSLLFQSFLRGVAASYITDATTSGSVFYIIEPNARNITVKNCAFIDIHRDAVSIAHAGGNVLIQHNYMSAWRMGSYFDWYWGKDHTAWQPDDTFIHFLDNYVDVNGGFDGIYFHKTTNIVVKNNTVENSKYGIGIISTRNGAVVSRNTVFDCFQGMYIRGLFRDGIEFEAVGAVVEKNNFYAIRDIGIAISGNASFGHTISKNKIHMVPTLADHMGLGVLSIGHDDYFGQNKISGEGNHVFCLWHTTNPDLVPQAFAHHEIMHANNVDLFAPVYCHFYFGPDTHDNLVIGSGMDHNSYWDDGYDNRIKGVTPMPEGIGEELREAIQKRNEELKEAKQILF
jgi:parallel beta-helix repeat protein